MMYNSMDNYILFRHPPESMYAVSNWIWIMNESCKGVDACVDLYAC